MILKIVTSRMKHLGYFETCYFNIKPSSFLITSYVFMERLVNVSIKLLHIFFRMAIDWRIANRLIAFRFARLTAYSYQNTHIIDMVLLFFFISVINNILSTIGIFCLFVNQNITKNYIHDYCLKTVQTVTNEKVFTDHMSQFRS